MRKKFFVITWSVLLSLLLLGILGTFCINRGWIGYMPPIAELQNPISRYASQIISAD